MERSLQKSGSSGTDSNVTLKYGVVGKREFGDAVLENWSDETALAFSGLPYSAVGIDYHNLAGQPRDYEDLFITISSGSARQYLCLSVSSNGVPQFQDDTTGAFGSSLDSELRGSSQADFDNDGDLDLFVAGGVDHLARLYRNEGNGTYSDQSGILGIPGNRDYVHAGAWCDYDGDGWVDLYLCRRNVPGGAPLADILLQNKIAENGLFYDATTLSGIDAGSANITNSIAAVWADVNGDDRPDLFVAENGSAGNPPDPSVHARLFISDASELGTFTEEASLRFSTQIDAMHQMTSVDVADVDLDGDADLVAGFDGQSQGAIIYRNDGVGYFPAEDAFVLSDMNGTSGVRFLDLGLDGRPDLLLTSSDQATEPRYYYNFLSDSDQTEFFNVAHQIFGSDIGGTAVGIVALDWNRDGDQDLFLGRETAANNFFYRTTRRDGADHPEQTVISIRLSSPSQVNNAAGIGAKVHVLSKNQTMVQWVDGGSGRGGQDDLVLTFPVDPLPSGDKPITVTWPNGWNQIEGVPIHTPGSSPYVVVDNTNPTVNDASVSAYSEYDPVQDVMTFVFSWQTEYGFDPAMDKISFVDVPGQCNLNLSEITPTTPGATHTYMRLSTGVYRHDLRWTGWECVPGCTIPYTVTSGHHTGITSTSSQKHLKFRFCPSSL